MQVRTHPTDFIDPFKVGGCLNDATSIAQKASSQLIVKQLTVNIPHSHDVFIIQLQSEVVLSVEEHLAHPECQPTHLRIHSATLIK